MRTIMRAELIGELWMLVAYANGHRHVLGVIGRAGDVLHFGTVQR